MLGHLFPIIYIGPVADEASYNGPFPRDRTARCGLGVPSKPSSGERATITATLFALKRRHEIEPMFTRIEATRAMKK